MIEWPEDQGIREVRGREIPLDGCEVWVQPSQKWRPLPEAGMIVSTALYFVRPKPPTPEERLVKAARAAVEVYRQQSGPISKEMERLRGELEEYEESR